ncbi:MAG: alpha-glucosidase [Lachnospiraceae bacterium]|nr:alpha-glucosidase [Lachnospiraceae bacterium]
MIYRLKLGNPFETDAVVNFDDVNDRSDVEFLELLGNLEVQLFIDNHPSEGDPAVTVTYEMSDEAVIYGLGESMRGMNKRGYKYISDNTDEPDQLEGKHSLYGSHNFIVVKDREEIFGLFFDYPGKMEFDLGFTHRNEIKITVPARDVNIYMINGVDIKGIVKQFRKIIGQSYIPPLWAFGFGQSRYSYETADEVREVVNKYRKLGIPLDSVYLDIHYMDGFKNFTVDKKRFPNFAEFVEELREQGVRLVPIIDAAIKNEEGYQPYDEAKAKGYLCTNEDNSLFGIGVWPGWCNLPDFLRPEVRAWWGEQYATLTDAGIEGFWNDMNEPAIFYTGWSFGATIDLLDELALNENEPKVEDVYRISDSINAWRSHNEYKHFYHKVDGKKIRHDKVHNLYGYMMTRGAFEGLEQQLGGKRPLLFSRSSYIGAHRYGGIWTGDNNSWWSHLLLNLQQLPGLNMCGFLYSGADTGGFGYDTSEDLLMRWIALSIFTPLFRNHSVIGSRRQECYAFDNTEGFKEIIALRYRLIPYLYSEYLKAALNDEMLFRPLGFDYEDDDFAHTVEDQLLLGEGLMIAPVYQQNAVGRYVYLPEEMLFIRFKSATEYKLEVLSAGHHYIECALTEVPLFLRRGNILPLGNVQVCTDDMRHYKEAGSSGELNGNDFEIISWPEAEDETPRSESYEMLIEVNREIVVNNIFKINDEEEKDQ